MKNTFKILTLIAFTIAITCTSCSSNNQEDAIFEREQLSEVVMKDFVQKFENTNVPEGLSNSASPYAQQANTQFELLKIIGVSFTSFFTIPSDAVFLKSNEKQLAKSAVLNTQTYTWSAGGESVTYTISEESDRYTFNYTIVSSDFNGKVMEGFQLKDETYAEVNLFDDNQEGSTIKWWVNTTTTKIELDADGFRLVLESNSTDNSGTIQVYEDALYIALYSWEADGSGFYKDLVSNQTFTW